MEKIINRKTYYSGSTLKIEKIKVDLNNGKIADWELGSFNNKDNYGSVGIVPITKNNNIILLKYYHPGLDKKIITIPGGGVKKNETEIFTANKELIEETGFESKNLTKITTLSPLPGYLELSTTIFLAQKLVENKTLKGDEIEDIEIIEIPFLEAVKMCKNGDITDARTVAAILIIAGSSLLA